MWVEFLATVLPARIDAACWVLHTLASRVDTLLAFMGVCPVANVRGGFVAICVAALKVNVNVNELRLGFSNTTRNPEGILLVSYNNRKS